MNVAELAQLLAPFIAVLGASAWLHSTIGDLKTTIATLTERVRHLEAELERLRNRKPQQ